MRKLSVLAATLGLCAFILGCIASISAQTPRLDTRFVRLTEPTLGLSVDEIVSRIGVPDEKTLEDCKVPLKEGDKPRMISGDSWTYGSFESKSATLQQLSLCIIKGYSLGERRRLIHQTGDFVRDSIEEVFDLSVIKKVYENRPQSGPGEIPTGNPVPELEL